MALIMACAALWASGVAVARGALGFGVLGVALGDAAFAEAREVEPFLGGGGKKGGKEALGGARFVEARRREPVWAALLSEARRRERGPFLRGEVGKRETTIWGRWKKGAKPRGTVTSMLGESKSRFCRVPKQFLDQLPFWRMPCFGRGSKTKPTGKPSFPGSFT